MIIPSDDQLQHLIKVQQVPEEYKLEKRPCQACEKKITKHASSVLVMVGRGYFHLHINCFKTVADGWAKDLLLVDILLEGDE